MEVMSTDYPHAPVPGDPFVQAPAGPPSHLPPPSPHRTRGGRRRTAAVAGLTVLSFAAGAGGGLLAADRGSDPPGTTVTAAPVDLKTASIDVSDLVDAVEPSVVSVESSIEERWGPYVQSGTGAGTGVVLDDGYIVTNAHVVEGATDITITPAAGAASRSATLVGLRPVSGYRRPPRRRYVWTHSGDPRRRLERGCR